MFANSIQRSWTTRNLRAATKLLSPAILALVLCGSVPAHAQTSKDEAAFLNLHHTLVVRKALSKEKELASLNLGVKVENRIAYLWGPVPSAKLLARAVKLAKDLPDIVDVQNHLYVDESEEMEM